MAHWRVTIFRPLAVRSTSETFPTFQTLSAGMQLLVIKPLNKGHISDIKESLIQRDPVFGGKLYFGLDCSCSPTLC